MAKVIVVEGIGPVYAQKLQDAGIASTDALLQAGASAKGRQELAEKTGIGESLILEWVNRVDLMRINGVGEEYSDLLEASGVDTIPELAQRKPENLHAKMEQVNAEKKLVRRLPALTQVVDWVEQAKSLPRVVTH